VSFKTVALGVCVWIVWMFIILQMMDPNRIENDIFAMIVALAATVLSIYLFNRLAPKRSD
jgi:hypothetical protein